MIVTTNSDNYQDIADSIRYKNGTPQKYYPSQMDEAIKALEAPIVDFATKETAGIVQIGANIDITEDGVISIATTDNAEQDNTKPITSAGVYAQLGNINALLEQI